ncbi:uncharacterized protein BDR25DRAFT_307873 [Lindgomyces ingoldianus]|uniref:Uncharacterized protein n=1 Tax=Lindgomyces ingoldianus TaxID=673940 RepID=A0ACB6QAV6_9PLEO|nr:uncharacterized protein BDR25DRAFT_307873 [Lindgomyces ingoldianus]KAF2463280.1 hypothetical protein BDR25DRAFT_307873 [Lindgomyces ingoldianus]
MLQLAIPTLWPESRRAAASQPVANLMPQPLAKPRLPMHHMSRIYHSRDMAEVCILKAT